MNRSFDTETHGLDWFEPDHGPFLATWSDTRGNDHLAHVDDERAMSAFKSDMKASKLIVAHNLPFDAHQLREHTAFDVLNLGVPTVDTDLLARVVVPERRSKGADDDRESYEMGYKLADLSKTYLPEETQKIDLDAAAKDAGIKLKETNGYWNFFRAYPDLFRKYAMMDTRATLDVLPHLARKLDDRSKRIWQLEKTCQPHLIRAEARGVAVDPEKVAPLKVEYERRLDESYADVVKVLGSEAVGDPHDPTDKDDHDAMREALLAHGVPLSRKVKSCKHGDNADCDCKYATNKFALKEFESDFPVISDIFKLRTASKFLATYIGPMEGRLEVHPTFWQIGAWTGRMSCSRPNMQNLPARGEGAAELRAMFIPRPGYCYVVSDFDAIEARLLAHYLGKMGISYREMIRNGYDVHSWMASQIWGGSAADYAKGGPNDKKRSLAKNILFAIVYGAGAPRVMDMLADAGMPSTRAHAKALIKAIKRSLPGYFKISKRVRNKVEHFGYVNTIMGRRQPVKADKAYVGLNALIQGSAADIFKQAIINVNEAVNPLGALPIMFVHDEIGTECPVEYAEECRVLQEQAMIDAWDLDPALAVTSTICLNNYSEGK